MTETANQTLEPTAESVLDFHKNPVYDHFGLRWLSWSDVEADGGAWTQICVPNYQSDKTAHEFNFSKGGLEIVLAITGRLAQRCGPFLVVDDSGSLPVVVAASSNSNSAR